MNRTPINQKQALNVLFKIQKSVDGKVVVFALSGRIESAGLTQLQKLLESEPHDQSLILDLTEVKLVDRDVISFLGIYEARGVKITNCPAYIREWIEQAATSNKHG